MTFSNAKGLEPLGGNLYRQTAASGNPLPGEPGLDGRGALRQGYLEESNVDVVQQIAELIEAQRGYETKLKSHYGRRSDDGRDLTNQVTT